MYLRKALLQPRAKIEEILERQVGMQSAHNVEFRHSFGVTRSRCLVSLFQRHRIRARSILLPAKRAQSARRHANVRRIDMPVDVEISLVAVHPFAHRVRHPTDGKDVSGPIKSQRIIGVQALAGNNLGVDWLNAPIVSLKRMVWERGRHSIYDIAAQGALAS